MALSERLQSVVILNCDFPEDIITAVKILSEIGDIKRFRSANKLAQFAGIAPLKLSSSDKGKDVTNKLNQIDKRIAFSRCTRFYSRLDDPKSGLKIRFDKGVDGANGFEAVDHYHVMNPNYTNKKS